MRTVRLLVSAMVLAAVAAAPASAGINFTIAISGFAYDPPNKVAIVISGAYSLGFDNEDGVTHTGTANNGMFNTGNIPGGMSDSVLLFGAGSYPYHCNVHFDMTGKVSLRPTASASSIVAGQKVTIRVGADGLKGATFDVQRRRNGGAWRTVRSNISDPTPTFTLNNGGTYDFRSRIRFNAQVSGYSPVRKVTVVVA